MKKHIHAKAVRSFSLAAACLILVSTLLMPVSATRTGWIQALAYRLAGISTGTSPAIRQVEMNDQMNGYYGLPEANDWARLFVAVLYTDGTVQVVQHKDARVNFSAVKSWKNIEKIWVSGPCIFGLDKSGRLYCTDSSYDVSKATNVTDLFFIGGVYASCKDGSTIFIKSRNSYAEADPTVLGWKNVKKTILYHWNYPEWGALMLRTDGTIATNGNGGLGKMEGLRNVQDIFMVGETSALVQKDGTVCFQEGADPNLSGSVKLAPVEDSSLYLGMTKDGKLKIGGNMSDYDFFSKPGYFIGVDAIPKSNVADVVGSTNGMRGGNSVILYKDGTVVAPSAELNKSVRNWTNVVQLGWYEGYDFQVLYALHKDGSVTAAKMGLGGYNVEVMKNYQGWKLDKLYVKPFAGAVGITRDGKLVGDQAFGNLNFSTLTN